MTYEKAREKGMTDSTFFEDGGDVILYLMGWGHKPSHTSRGCCVFNIGSATITITDDLVSITRTNRDRVIVSSATCRADQLFEYKGMLFAGVEVEL